MEATRNYQENIPSILHFDSLTCSVSYLRASGNQDTALSNDG
jgi:hypothetical protein